MPTNNDGAQTLTVSLEPGIQQLEVTLEKAGGLQNIQIAEKLATPRAISLTGDAIGSALFDGSRDVKIYTGVERLTNEEIEELLK